MPWFSSYPSIAHRAVTKLLCLLHREGTHSHDPPRSTGFWWAGSSKGMRLTWAGTLQGSAPRNHVQSPLCRAPPSPPIGQSDPEPLRAGPELIIAPGQVSDPGLHMQPPSKSSRDFHLTLALGPCFHIPSLLSLTSGFLSLGEGLLEITSHLWAR